MRRFCQISAGVVLGLGAFMKSYACSCAPFNIEEAYARATYVFEADVRRSELVDYSDQSVGIWDSGISVIADFQLRNAWKGNPQELNGVISHSQDSACGVPLTPGTSYLFFVYDVWEDKGLLSSEKYGVVTTCSGPNVGRPSSVKRAINWLDEHAE